MGEEQKRTADEDAAQKNGGAKKITPWPKTFPKKDATGKKSTDDVSQQKAAEHAARMKALEEDVKAEEEKEAQMQAQKKAAEEESARKKAAEEESARKKAAEEESQRKKAAEEESA